MLLLAALPALAVDTYPVTDPELLSTRRIETEALYLALKKSGGARERYARSAAIAHLERMQALPPSVATHERAVERQGVGSGVVLQRSYPADELRQRALAVGEAIAVLLDDLMPGWRDDDRPLDVLLDEATSGKRPLLLDEDFPGAQEETRALQQAITTEATGYLTRAGYALTVVGDLAETRYDPFDAIDLGDHERLYRGDLELSGPAGTLSVEGHGAWVTTAELRVTGLALDDLEMAHEGDELVVSGPGLDLRLRGVVYTGSPAGMTIEIVPGASAEADPAVFALFAMASAAGYQRRQWSELRDRVRDGGARCTDDLARYRQLLALDDPWMNGMLAQTVLLGEPPTFAPDRDATELALAAHRDGRFVGLHELLASYWRCAGLAEVWDEVGPEWTDAAQLALERAAPALADARQEIGSRWPHVRIVPNLLDKTQRGHAVSVGDEVVVFVGPPELRRSGPDPALVLAGALHHPVDAKVRDTVCPAFDAAFEQVAGKPAVTDHHPTADAWLAESIVRALMVEIGAASPDDVAGWVDEGFPLIPGILAGLEREAWDVWVDEQCGGSDL